MAIPNLDDFTDALDERCRDYLGETISYAADGVSFASLKAHVDYRDGLKALEIATVIEQEITVSLMKSDVAAKPGSSVRLRLAKLTGMTLRPRNVRSDESGTHWEFEVMKVS